ncbi:MAG: hypothetical protein K0R50_4813 [Eubacterium sp.]|nr:hypothetical protein [Eubacterium sp.]
MTEQNNPYSEYDDSDEGRSTGQRMVVGMAYVPEQAWETPYDAFDGLDRGTLFPSLDKPFLGGGNRW